MTLVPPESYFDVSTGLFDLDLHHEYPEWTADFQARGLPPFRYHGRNVRCGVARALLWVCDELKGKDANGAILSVSDS